MIELEKLCDETHWRLGISALLIIAIAILALNSKDVNLLIILLSILVGVALPKRKTLAAIERGAI